MSQPNLLLITVDCLRPDALGCYGGPAHTPNIDQLAAGGVRYRNAFAHAHFTRPAFAAIFSGSYPWQWGGSARFSEERPSFVQALQAGGYQTLGVNSNAWLTPKLGYGRGFTVYRDQALARPFAHRFPVKAINNLLALAGGGLVYPPYPPGERVTAAALELLPASRQPFFLWLHYMDAHWPYNITRPRLYGPRDRRYRVYNPHLARRSREVPARVTPEERQALQGVYYRAVERVDREIGRLLERAGDRCTVILTADHGEAFGEHGRYFHGLGLYAENVEVPLILSGPGLPAGGVENGIVRHIDIAPSLLDLAGLASPQALTGVSLIPAAQGKARLPELEAVSAIEDPQHGLRWVGLREKVWTALLFFQGERLGAAPSLMRAELYDRASDPGERVNVGERFPERLRSLAERALAHFGPVEPATGSPLPEGLDAELVERLKALGYLE